MNCAPNVCELRVAHCFRQIAKNGSHWGTVGLCESDGEREQLVPAWRDVGEIQPFEDRDPVRAKRTMVRQRLAVEDVDRGQVDAKEDDALLVQPGWNVVIHDRDARRELGVVGPSVGADQEARCAA